MVSLFILLVVASILGWLGSAIAGRKQQGCLLNIALGFIGAILGRWLSRTLAVSDPMSLTIRDTTFPLFWTIIGSALFVAAISFLTGSRRGSER